MLDTSFGSAAEKRLRESIEEMVVQLDGSSELAAVLNALVTAVDYKDPVLVQSRLNGVFAAIRDQVQEIIADLSGAAASFWDRIPTFWHDLEESAPEFHQELGKSLESAFDRILSERVGLRDHIVKKLQTLGFEVGNAKDLEQEIVELQSLKETVLKDWPWEDRPLPPVDWNLVAESRSAFARNEGVRLEEIIRRMEGASAN